MLIFQITIMRIERNKRKYVTTVLGLESFGSCPPSPYPSSSHIPPPSLADDTHPPQGVDLKKAAKLFAQKFATGASVTKNAQNLEDITVQGDVTHEIVR